MANGLTESKTGCFHYSASGDLLLARAVGMIMWCAHSLGSMSLAMSSTLWIP